MSRLDDKVAVVTGATRGIGRAIAETLVDAGSRVVVAARDADAVRDAAADLNGRVGRTAALGIVCDVRRNDDCRRLIGGAVDAFHRIDILVNNAGIGVFGAVETFDPGAWDDLIATNLSGMFYCTRAAIPHLRQAGESWILNIGSLAGKNAFPNGAAYNASKFGLIGFSEALMQEVRHDGIRVSYIMPGSVATEFAGNDPAAGEAWKIAPQDVAQVVMDLLAFPSRSLPSRVELRPSRPPRK
ncbi:MAG: SDR family oxidoreductase [Gemmatimonadota bacterium]|jgi:NAD(P)-dependent dehydrogenase (short-subunit alcohol dehydrogenase family)